MDNDKIILIAILGLAGTVYIYRRYNRGTLWLAATTATIALASLGLFYRSSLLFAAVAVLNLALVIYYFHTQDRHSIMAKDIKIKPRLLSKLANITRIFIAPLILITATALGAAIFVTALGVVDGPIRPSGIFGAITGAYLVWFCVEGRKQLKKLTRR